MSASFFGIIWKLIILAAVASVVAIGYWFYKSGKYTMLVNKVKTYVQPRKVAKIKATGNTCMHYTEIKLYDLSGTDVTSKTKFTGTMSGIYGGLGIENLWDGNIGTNCHTGCTSTDWIEVVLATPMQLGKIVFLGKADSAAAITQQQSRNVGVAINATDQYGKLIVQGPSITATNVTDPTLVLTSDLYAY